MNPEFKRQLWLHFSLPRLILMPALLLVGALAVVLSSKPGHIFETLAVAGAIAFGLLALVFGVGAAGASISDEFRQRTWDQQRMSAMQPWPMTWGKLAGSTAYSWYGSVICLGMIVACAWELDHPSWGLKIAIMVSTALFLQTLNLAVNVQLSKLDPRQVRQVWWLLILLLLLPHGVRSVSRWIDDDTLLWWGQSWSTLQFLLGSLLIFTVCAVVAAWRSMAESLSVQQLPWGLPVVGLLAIAYLTGFASELQLQWSLDRGASVMGVAGVCVYGAMTYFALISDPQSRPVWQRFVTRAAAGQWHAALMQVPRWATSLVLTLLFGLLSLFAAELRELWLPGSALAWALLVARDSALALFFVLATQGRQPLAAFLVTLLVLHGLMPWLAVAVEATGVRAVLYPPISHSELAANGLAFLHALLAWALLIWRWRASSIRQDKPTASL